MRSGRFRARRIKLEEYASRRPASGQVAKDNGAISCVDHAGAATARVTHYVDDGAVFASEHQAFEYLMALSKRDLQYRGLRDDCLSCFHWKQEASHLLYERVRNCDDEAE